MKSTARLKFEAAAIYTGAFIGGIVLSPLLAFYSFFKGLASFLAAPHKYFWEALPRPDDKKTEYNERLARAKALPDLRAKTMSGTVVLGRIGAIALATVCVLGFVGALAVPIPGVAPLYTASVLGIAKAVGVTIGFTIAGRTAGSLIGGIFDYCKLRSIFLSNKGPNLQENLITPESPDTNGSAGKILSSTKICLKSFAVHSLCGDIGFAAKKQLNINAAAQKAVAKGCNASTPPSSFAGIPEAHQSRRPR